MQQQPTHPSPAQPLFSERFTSVTPTHLPRPSEFYRRLLHFHDSCSYDAQRLIYPNGSLDTAEIAESLPGCLSTFIEMFQEEVEGSGDTLDQVVNVPSMILNILGNITMLGLVAEASWRTHQQCDTNIPLSQVFTAELEQMFSQTLQQASGREGDASLSNIFAALDVGAVVLNEIFAEIAPPPAQGCGPQPCLNCQSYHIPSVKE